VTRRARTYADTARVTRRARTYADTARPRSPAAADERFVPGVLAGPPVRLGLSAAALAATAAAARGGRVGPWEARAFEAVNGLPGSLYRPAWVVMQLGAFGAIPAAAATAWLAGDAELAGRLLIGGTATWGLAKLVKQVVRRPRPDTLLPGARRRGRDAAGLGYPSGHAGVAAVLGAAALPRLGPAGRALVLTAIPAVGLTRVYVGAHLPLDIAGGAALGLTVGAAAAVVLPGRRPGGGSGKRAGVSGWRRASMGRR
jgi:glycosyltransferase 2 family protein